jgi:hypothetical protein
MICIFQELTDQEIMEYNLTPANILVRLAPVAVVQILARL